VNPAAQPDDAVTVDHPLHGIRVLECGDDLALAFCGKYLAALGADVFLESVSRLQDESPWVRAYVDDGKHARAGSGIEHIDIVLTTNHARGPAAPDAIRVIISDNGSSGPQSAWKGGEIIAQASAGLMHLVGEPERAPLQLGGHQIDYSAGLMAFTASMIALTGRCLNGQAGQDIEISRLEAAAYIEWKGRVYSQAGNELTRGELSGPVVIRCLDGYFGFYYRASDWPKVLELFDAPVLRQPPFDTHQGRVEHRVEFAELLSHLCSKISGTELYHRLQALNVPAGPVYDAHALLSSQQYGIRDFFYPNTSAGPGAVQPGVAVRFNGLRPIPKEAQS
jgi:crotonobetainyl-CoA:carnitine CoA-transferase CaiB-like acyl-CoA transferase